MELVNMFGRSKRPQLKALMREASELSSCRVCSRSFFVSSENERFEGTAHRTVCTKLNAFNVESASWEGGSGMHWQPRAELEELVLWSLCAEFT